MPARSKPVEHKRRVGRGPGVDAAGKRLSTVTALPTPTGSPPLPGHLGGCAEHWERIFSANWVSPIYDVMGVQRLCEMYQQRAAMQKSLAETGWMLERGTGAPMANPMVGQINRLDTEIRHLEVEFGLTPAARARLGLTEVQRQSRLDEMMRRQREA